MEVPVSEHKRPEIKEGNIKKIHNLENNETFELVNVGQEMIGSHWVVAKNEKHDGRKIEFMARLVAGGFQEADKR